MRAAETRESHERIYIDYSRSLGSMIGDARLDKVSPDINPRTFHLTARGFRELDILFVQFLRPVTPLRILTFMNSRGYRPITIEELLALGCAHPDLQRSTPIVALGSTRIVNERRYFPCLGGSQSSRDLTLIVIYQRFSVYYRFAFVKY